MCYPALTCLQLSNAVFKFIYWIKIPNLNQIICINTLIEYAQMFKTNNDTNMNMSLTSAWDTNTSLKFIKSFCDERLYLFSENSKNLMEDSSGPNLQKHMHKTLTISPQCFNSTSLTFLFFFFGT